MAQAGDAGRPLFITEIGVASAGGANDFDLGASGQAHFLAKALGRLAAERRRWRIGGVYWFTWRDGAAADPNCVFCEYAGLFNAGDQPKPAWPALRRTVSRWGP